MVIMSNTMWWPWLQHQLPVETMCRVWMQPNYVAWSPIYGVKAIYISERSFSLHTSSLWYTCCSLTHYWLSRKHNTKWYDTKSVFVQCLSPSWIHPAVPSRASEAPEVSPWTTFLWSKTPEHSPCLGSESRSCSRRWSDTAPCLMQTDPRIS